MSTLFVLHLFSGKRRPQDVQHYFEGFVQCCNLIVVSIDVQICTERGDLTKSETVQFWAAGLRQGKVIGVIAGPPCETW